MSATVVYEELRPSARFRPFIECFWSVANPAPVARRPPDHIVPDGCPELIVHLAHPFSRRADGRWRRQGNAFLAGTLSRPWIVRAGRTIDTFGVRFRPGAFPTFAAVDMQGTVDREVALAELFGAAAARRFRPAILAEQDLATRAAAAEAWLAALERPDPSAAANSTRDAVRLIQSRRGGVRVEEVARSLAISRRQLERRFARDVGIRPKLYARIVRLQAALLEIGGDERDAGVEVALAAGYFDQSHLARDFRGIAGRPARRRRAEDGEMARHFTAPERLLALLAGE